MPLNPALRRYDETARVVADLQFITDRMVMAPATRDALLRNITELRRINEEAPRAEHHSGLRSGYIGSRQR